MQTTLTTLQKPSRWNASFDPEMTDAEADRILGTAPFDAMNPSAFPRNLALRNIVRHDTRLRRFRAGEIVVREGDYGNSAFMILSGSAQVALTPLHPSLLGRRDTKKKGLWRTIAQLWSNSREPERHERLEASAKIARNALEPTRVFLQDLPRILEKNRTAVLEPGDFFGEIAALSRMPRGATVIARENAELIEVRWQGLRDLMRYDEALREYINRIYHDRALETHLLSIPIFARLDEANRRRLMAETQFATYGQYEWTGEYKRMAQLDPAVRAEQEPVIAREGDYPNGVVLIRAGFARLSQKFGSGERTLNYLGAGQQYGIAEIIRNWRDRASGRPLQHTLRAVGYTHVLIVPTHAIEELVLPTLAEAEIGALIGTLPSDEPKENGAGGIGQSIGPDLFEFLTDNRYFNGTATMVIDLDRCTRCDDCVRACAAAHDNNPRFLRQGPNHGRVMVANACMHCTDPVCMIGCPTGAIGRNSIGGQVVINPATCIGCKTCFNNCPYDAIRMVEARDESGVPMLDGEMKSILKATKCDLCIEQMVAPSCQRACPHGALARMNMNNLNSFAAWLHR